MRMAHRISAVRLRAWLTARWTFRVSGTLGEEVVEAIAVVAAGPQPQVAQQHRPQVLRQRVPRLVEPEQRQHRPRVELRQRVERRRLAAPVVAQAARAVAADAVAAAGLRPARPTRMAPSTLHSSRWPDKPSACRRCSSGRRI